MVSEFFPLQSLIVVDIDLSEQFDQVLDQTHFVFGLRQMVQHHFNELLYRQPLLVVLYEVLLYLLQLPVIQMTHYIIIVFIKMLVLLYGMGL